MTILEFQRPRIETRRSRRRLCEFCQFVDKKTRLLTDFLLPNSLLAHERHNITTTFQNVDVGRQWIEIKTKVLIMVANLTRIDAALISHNISRYAGDGIPQFDCSIHSLQFDLRHWNVPPGAFFASQYSEMRP
jgi:hypothetical protein